MGNAPVASTNTNIVKTLVPQNNLAQEQDFCPSCNFSYEYCMCYKTKPSQALTMQDQAIGKQYSARQPTNVSHLQK